MIGKMTMPAVLSVFKWLNRPPVDGLPGPQRRALKTKTGPKYNRDLVDVVV